MASPVNIEKLIESLDPEVYTYFSVEPPSEDDPQAGAQAEAQASKYNLNKTEKAILAYLDKGPSSRSDIINLSGKWFALRVFQRDIEGIIRE